MGRVNSPEDVFKFINTHDNDPEVCWEWTGALAGRDGRGYITILGSKQLSYRVVYQIFHGPIPEGQVVRHICDNPRCCNPLHLETGSRRENELDKYKRGRAGYPLFVVTEINRILRAAKRENLNVSYKFIKEQVDVKFGINISVTGIGKIARGERREAQKDIDNEPHEDHEASKPVGTEDTQD